MNERRFSGKAVTVLPANLNKPNTALPIPQFDLTKINVVQLAQDLSQFIHQPQPRSLISKWWQSKKLPYDRERIDHIISYVEQVRDLNSRITHLQAELYLSPQVLQSLLEQKIELANAQFKLQIKEFEARIDELDFNCRMREQQLNRVIIENAILGARQLQEEAKANFIKTALSKVDLSVMSEAMKSFITQIIFAPNLSGFTPLEAVEQLQKLVIQEKEANIRMQNAIARKEEYHADAVPKFTQADLSEKEANVLLQKAALQREQIIMDTLSEEKKALIEAQRIASDKEKIQTELERLNMEEQYRREGREPPGFK